MTTLKYQSIAVVGAVLTTLVTTQLSGALVTPNDPELHRVPPGSWSGLVFLDTLYFSCTGSLLKGGLHILTAAHCVTDENGKFDTKIYRKTKATFTLNTGSVTIPIVDFFVHPGYDGKFYKGNDIAVLRLSKPAPSAAEQYDIYRNTDEVGQIFTQVGYGYTGTGYKGYDVYSNSDHQGYYGFNQFDALGETFNGLLKQIFPDFAGVIPGSQLLYDFDSGLAKDDAFGVHYGINDTGLGNYETNTAPGDSGGPAFIGNLIAGITSYGMSDNYFYPHGPVTDVDWLEEPNSSFGEFSANTRVSYYGKFIDDAIAGKVASTVPRRLRRFRNLFGFHQSGIYGYKRNQLIAKTPEPTPILGMFAAIGVSLSLLLRRQNSKSA